MLVRSSTLRSPVSFPAVPAFRCVSEPAISVIATRVWELYESFGLLQESFRPLSSENRGRI